MNADIARATWCIETGVFRWKIKRGSKVKAGENAGSKFRSKKNVYLTVYFNGRNYLVHRLIWLITYGEWPKGEIDHIDGNGLNNNLENLRDVSGAENNRNQRLYNTNTSGRCGVCWFNRDSKWRAKIQVDRKTIHLGLFDEFDDAVAARKDAERKYGYHANHGRVSVEVTE